jgi:hypothetical protein
MTLDIGRAFTYMFDDESWIMKIVIGGVLGLIPIVDLIVLGYMVEALKRSADGMEVPMPEWDDFGGKFMKGLIVLMIGVVYTIPILVPGCALVGALFVFGENEGLMAIVTTCGVCVGLIGAIYGILVALVWPAAVVRYVVTGDFMSAFQFGELFSFISANIANYIVAVIVGAVVGGVATAVGAIACGVGGFFTGFWATLVAAQLLGQVQRESLTVG